jgi:hypothetical protein
MVYWQRFDLQIQLCGLMEIEYFVREGEWDLVRFNQMTD